MPWCRAREPVSAPLTAWDPIVDPPPPSRRRLAGEKSPRSSPVGVGSRPWEGRCVCAALWWDDCRRGLARGCDGCAGAAVWAVPAGLRGHELPVPGHDHRRRAHGRAGHDAGTLREIRRLAARRAEQLFQVCLGAAARRAGDVAVRVRVRWDLRSRRTATSVGLHAGAGLTGGHHMRVPNRRMLVPATTGRAGQLHRGG